MTTDLTIMKVAHNHHTYHGYSDGYLRNLWDECQLKVGTACDDSTWIYHYNRCYGCHMCADTDFTEEKENIVIYCVFIKRPQYFIENNEILRLILF